MLLERNSRPVSRYFGKIPGWLRQRCRHFHRNERGFEAVTMVILLAMGAMVTLFLWKDVWTAKLKPWILETITAILG